MNPEEILKELLNEKTVNKLKIEMIPLEKIYLQPKTKRGTRYASETC
jgi:hypothetical protein